MYEVLLFNFKNLVMMQQMNLFGGQEPVKSGQADLHEKVRRAVALIRSMGLQNTPPLRWHIQAARTRT